MRVNERRASALELDRGCLSCLEFQVVYRAGKLGRLLGRAALAQVITASFTCAWFLKKAALLQRVFEFPVSTRSNTPPEHRRVSG